LFLFLLYGTLRAESWWDKEWPSRKKITIDTAAAGITEPIGTTPVLMRLHDGNFQFDLAKPDGTDLRFVAADDKTVLTHHVEKFDSLLHEALVWVKLPDLKPGAQTTVWLYYGNGGPKAVNNGDPKGTYDSDTALVWHFSERNTPPQDSSGNANTTEKAGVNVAGSFIAGGLRLDGTVPLTIPPTTSLVWSAGGSLTLSLWAKPTVLAPNAILLSRTEGTNVFALGFDNGVPFVEVNGQRSTGGAPLTANTWKHVAVVAGGGQITLWLDGEKYSTLSAALPALNSATLLGGAEGATGFTGEIDELEISKTARPIGFIKLAALGQAGGDKAAKLFTFANEQAPANWLSWLEGGYLGIIVKNLTFDGWIVIGVLAVMFLISWWVMISKARYLSKITKANKVFTREWRRVESDPEALEEGIGAKASPAEQKLLRQSPLYRVYHIGAETIRHRLALRPDQPRSLTARAIQAVRARLDGGQVIEVERINSQIVLLTIAISGGPFLGLLGTVVGVMITFAAVAAAGDVNVNAIAPGIAAALLATVAGLAVAIPALFGYNYLLSRIKAANTALHVFIDEFVTSMAEHYRGGPAE
jgi:biopolymer transport protein ExbB